MLRRNLCFLAALLICSLPFVARGQEYDVFLLLGQANMAGRGEMLPSDEEIIDDNLYLLDSDGDVELACSPLNRYSTIKKPGAKQGIGPGHSFGKMIARSTGHKVLLVVNARGGSKLSEWQKGSETGYFEETVRRADQAIRHGGKVKAILWHHGEGDCRDTTYLSRLAVMVQDMRAELGDDQIPFIGFRASAGQKILALQFLQQRCQGAGIQIQQPSQFLRSQGVLLPQHHHGDILGVGQSDLFQMGGIELDGLPGAGIQRKAQLAAQLQAIILFFIHDGTSGRNACLFT